MKKYILLLFSILLFSCSNKNEEKQKMDNGKKFEMYQLSEMAILMEQMYVNNFQLKSRIVNGAYLGKFPERFLDIHTAVMTKKQENDKFFKDNAKIYIAEHQKIYTDPENAKVHFNNSIDICVKCHQEKCTGPIQRIKKLYIK
ncbi:hypothetical protein [Flavobacterium sp. H122]|uniref:hypothetical protein n=1 Tax=Flavobacterium sp. H122 TaxID=2529860 RepID=UPI0010A9AE99|nr:hypothetical protein [Flavobacterium sp. H122]